MTKQRDTSDKKIKELLNDTSRLTKILQAGIHRALLRHKQAGNAICEWREGKVVWIPADRIVINEKKPSAD